MQAQEAPAGSGAKKKSRTKRQDAPVPLSEIDAVELGPEGRLPFGSFAFSDRPAFSIEQSVLQSDIMGEYKYRRPEQLAKFLNILTIEQPNYCPELQQMTEQFTYKYFHLYQRLVNVKALTKSIKARMKRVRRMSNAVDLSVIKTLGPAFMEAMTKSRLHTLYMASNHMGGSVDKDDVDEADWKYIVISIMNQLTKLMKRWIAGHWTTMGGSSAAEPTGDALEHSDLFARYKLYDISGYLLHRLHAYMISKLQNKLMTLKLCGWFLAASEHVDAEFEIPVADDAVDEDGALLGQHGVLAEIVVKSGQQAALDDNLEAHLIIFTQKYNEKRFAKRHFFEFILWVNYFFVSIMTVDFILRHQAGDTTSAADVALEVILKSAKIQGLFMECIQRIDATKLSEFFAAPEISGTRTDLHTESDPIAVLFVYMVTGFVMAATKDRHRHWIIAYAESGGAPVRQAISVISNASKEKKEKEKKSISSSSCA